MTDDMESKQTQCTGRQCPTAPQCADAAEAKSQERLESGLHKMATSQKEI